MQTGDKKEAHNSQIPATPSLISAFHILFQRQVSTFLIHGHAWKICMSSLFPICKVAPSASVSKELPESVLSYFRIITHRPKTKAVT